MTNNVIPFMTNPEQHHKAGRVCLTFVLMTITMENECFFRQEIFLVCGFESCRQITEMSKLVLVIFFE